MYKIRMIQETDFHRIANMEVEISKISFGEEAITDLSFHRKKIESSYNKGSEGMYVLADDSDEAVGWMWMDKKSNYLTNEVYVNFRSFYINDSVRGSEYVDQLLDRGVEYADKIKAQYIVGKVHTDNIAMRSLYKNHGFAPTHITMERKL